MATFGPSMAIVTSVTILAFLVGSLISYFIITGLPFALLLTLSVVYVMRGACRSNLFVPVLVFTLKGL